MTLHAGRAYPPLDHSRNTAPPLPRLARRSFLLQVSPLPQLLPLSGKGGEGKPSGESRSLPFCFASRPGSARRQVGKSKRLQHRPQRGGRPLPPSAVAEMPGGGAGAPSTGPPKGPPLRGPPEGGPAQRRAPPPEGPGPVLRPGPPKMVSPTWFPPATPLLNPLPSTTAFGGQGVLGGTLGGNHFGRRALSAGVVRLPHTLVVPHSPPRVRGGRRGPSLAIPPDVRRLCNGTPCRSAARCQDFGAPPRPPQPPPPSSWMLLARKCFVSLLVADEYYLGSPCVLL